MKLFLYQKHKNFCKYDPRKFPGLTYYMKKPKVSLGIFSSGEVVVRGAKTQEDINTAIEKISPVLESFISSY